MMTKMALTQAYGDTFDHFSAEAKKNQELNKSKATRDSKVHGTACTTPCRTCTPPFQTNRMLRELIHPSTHF